jgi:hypothetical protein
VQQQLQSHSKISKLFELKKYFLGVIGVLGGKISCYLFSVLKISITARV